MPRLKKYRLKARDGVLSLRAPFRQDRCRIRLTFVEGAQDFPGRSHDRHYTVDLDPDVHSVICAMQQLRRWLIDRKAAAEADVERAGRYNDRDNIYRNCDNIYR